MNLYYIYTFDFIPGLRNIKNHTNNKTQKMERNTKIQQFHKDNLVIKHQKALS